MSEKTLIRCDGCLEASNYDEVDIVERRDEYTVFRCPLCGLVDICNDIFTIETGNEEEEAFLTELAEHPDKILEL